MSDLNGQVIIVTGANSGIGKVTARELAKMGATVVMVARSQERGSAALAEIRAASGSDDVHLMLCDLSSQASIRDFAAQFRAQFDRLDVLVNNAGAIFYERRESVDGLEMTFALNHMGYFLLTDLLLDMLKASAPARVVNVSSGAHNVGTVRFDDLQRKKRYSAFQAYGESKMMNILFTFELARRLEGSGVTANVMHPGFVATKFGHGGGFVGKVIMPILHLFALSEEQGAETVIYLAAAPEAAEVSGKYFVKKKPVQPHSFAFDRKAQKRLWKVSETAVIETTQG